jgi:YbbR domain-containing protein
MLERLTANWPLKLLALALAFAVWVSITGQNDVVRDFPVPLEIRLPADLTLAAEAPTSVTLRLRAPETSMRRIDPLGLGVRVSVERGISGQRDITIAGDNVIGVPPGVELEFITPNRLRLDVEQLIRRLIPVEATFAGEPPDGYAFYAAQVVPDAVTVEGPESAVEELMLLRTPTVRLDQFTRPFEVTVPLAPENRQLRVLDVDRALVRVVVDATPVEREFEGVSIFLDGQRFDMTYTPEALRVTLAAPPSLLDRIGQGGLQAVVDVSDLEPRGLAYQIKPQVVFLNNAAGNEQLISVRSVVPDQIQVRVPLEGDS